jgi:alkaline phosphatase D
VPAERSTARMAEVATAAPGGRAVGSEFGTSAITSPSVGDHLPQVPVGALLGRASDEAVFCDQRAKGYIRLTLTPGDAVADYVAVLIGTRPGSPTTIARFGRAGGEERLRHLPG